jgi:hypothetical protein
VTYICFLAPDSGGGSVAVLLRLAIDPGPVVERAETEKKEAGKLMPCPLTRPQSHGIGFNMRQIILDIWA